MGVTNALELFNQLMRDILSSIDRVKYYIDDILVHAKTAAEHDETQAGAMLSTKSRHHFEQREECFFVSTGDILRT